ncbi:MAG: TonB-dependent receptor plug domain-containing protein [Chitinophagaceae bacterium]|nr:TonB-dependent receptor plug domain-containing protein [Chitinophagaceae bacterium]
MKTYRLIQSVLLGCCILFVQHATAQTLTQGTYKNIYEMLQNVPGLEVKSGPKGGTVTVRGVSSLTRATGPLFVVDGSIYGGDIMSISPQDVDNIVVLKDAASTSAYGAQGSAGVILITMKKGANLNRGASATTHTESAYTYFIDHKTKLRVFGLDDAVIIEGVIQKQQGDSVLVFKKRKNDLLVPIKNIKRVEMMPADD